MNKKSTSGLTQIEIFGSHAERHETMGTETMKILAVDDDPIVLDLLRVMLINLGRNEPDTACDGSTAMQLLERSDSTYDCIFLDVTMPNIDGIELCKLLRSKKTYSQTPIVMLTARADKISVDGAFHAGATDYLNKPFETVELAARLRMASIINTKTQCQKYSKSSPFSDSDLGYIEKTIQHFDIPGLIDHNALCNYIAQLSKSGLAARQVTAIKIHDFLRIRKRASSSELEFILYEVADTIRHVFSDYDCMMSNCGNGTFIVASDKSNIRSAVEIEEKISSILLGRQLEFDNGDHVEVAVSIGNPIRPNTSKSHRVKRTLERAIARAQSRHDRKLQQQAKISAHVFRDPASEGT